jgi:adenosylcobyric acid synthase
MPEPEGPRAGGIAVLGTGSDVGKSLIATALGRLLSDAGIDVVPFKAQNMALQSGVTSEGGEMGRAQILQARACRVSPHVDMNPVLLKPTTDTTSQVVVLGRSRGIADARSYFTRPSTVGDDAEAALMRLARSHQAIVIEGAGSPVELNLMERDFVNLRPARALQAAIVLVADIDRGGVFAQVKGTVDLLPAPDRERLVGIIVNRFRGDPELFEPGIELLERLVGCPVLAVVPWMRHGLDEEDRPFDLPLDSPRVEGRLNVGVVLHPRVANTDDLAPLLAELDTAATWITRAESARGRDLVILPGTKATIADLIHHTAAGLVAAVQAAAQEGAWVLGLCGGYQMLGRQLVDPHGTDGSIPTWPGLGLLEAETRFEPEKVLANPQLTSAWPIEGGPLDGYEVHHGRTTGRGDPLVVGAGAEIGLVNGRAVGTYLHGLLRSDQWRAAFLNRVRRDRGLPVQPIRQMEPLDLRIDRWAAHVRQALRSGAWGAILRSLGPVAGT